MKDKFLRIEELITLTGLSQSTIYRSESALVAAKQAETSWIRVSANMGLGGYDVFKATAADLPDPSGQTSKWIKSSIWHLAVANAKTITRFVHGIQMSHQ